jgi:integrase
MYKEPLKCLLTSFCFYHGLSSNQIVNIKLKDIDFKKRLIRFKERPPLYLLKDDMIFLQEYARLRIKIKNANKKDYLFISSSASEIYSDKLVSNKFVRDKVKELTGFTPKKLRIACFNTIASKFGPQLLVEGLGLSLTHASRYGKLEDFLIEESINEQRELLEKLQRNE